MNIKVQRSVALFLLMLASSLLSQFAVADEKKEAVAMVKKAVEFMAKQGKEKLLAEINAGSKEFKKGETYVFVYGSDGTIVAHPTNPKLVGKNLVSVPDPNGKPFRKEILEIANTKGSGWVDYKYLNPDNRKVEEKTTYFEKSGDVIIACGIYR